MTEQLTRKRSVGYSNTMTENVDAREGSPSENIPQEIQGIVVEASEGINPEESLQEIEAEIEKVLDEAAEKIKKEKEGKEEVKKTEKAEVKASTENNNEDNKPDKLEKTLKKISAEKHKRIISKLEGIKDSQKNTFLNLVLGRIESDEKADIDETIDEAYLISTDYTPKKVSEVRSQEGLNRFLHHLDTLHQEQTADVAHEMRKSGKSEDEISEEIQKIDDEFSNRTREIKTKASANGINQELHSRLKSFATSLDTSFDEPIAEQDATDQEQSTEEKVDINEEKKDSEVEKIDEGESDVTQEEAEKNQFNLDELVAESSEESADDEEAELTEGKQHEEELRVNDEDQAADAQHKESAEEIQDQDTEIVPEEANEPETEEGQTEDSQEEESEEDMGKKKKREIVSDEIVDNNAGLNDEKRKEEAVRLLGELTEEQKEAILEAHRVGYGELGKNGKKAGVRNYTLRQLVQKTYLLQKAGFTAEQIKRLILHGVVGVSLEEAMARGEGIADSLVHTATGTSTFDRRNTESQSHVRSEERKRYWNTPEGYDLSEMDQARGALLSEATSSIQDDIEAGRPYQGDIDGAGEYSTHVPITTPDIQRAFQRELAHLQQHQYEYPEDVHADLVQRVWGTLREVGQLNEKRKEINEHLQALRQGSMDASTLPEINKLEQERNRIDLLAQRSAQAIQDELSRMKQEAGGRSSRERDEAIGEQRFGGDPGAPVLGGGRDGGIPGGTDGHGIRLIGKEGSGDEESEPYGKSVRSIEDLGNYMEELTPEYQNRIMAQLYLYNGEIVSEIPFDPDLSEAEKADLKKKYALYAWKIGAGDYARDVDNKMNIDDGNERNRVMMLTREQIEAITEPDDPDIPRTTLNVENARRHLERVGKTPSEIDGLMKLWEEKRYIQSMKQAIGGRRAMNRSGGERAEYWESVRVVRPDMYLNWMRSYWTILHNDDPDNPADFFRGVMVNHPDQRGGVDAARMHKDSGTFLRSRFLLDPVTGQGRVYNQLKDAIINEMWIPSGERNNEVLYKAIMHADEELPKTKRDRIGIGNLPAKTASGGKNTMAMFFTMAEHFQEAFDWKTGKMLSKEEYNERYDARLGTGILLAYEMYYNISDIDGLRKLLGENASFFNRDFITRAVLEANGEHASERLSSEDYERAKKYIQTVNDKVTILDSKYYDPATKMLIIDRESPEGKQNLKEWIGYINPYFPVQKDINMLRVIHRAVENQMAELTGIEKNPAASGIAHLHAWLRTYHDSVAARHDTGMGNRNSESKYEFIGAPGGYQDKQTNRDRAGFLYNRGVVWRTTVGMLHGMPTRSGETVQDILSRAITMQMDRAKEYNSLLKQLKNTDESKSILSLYDNENFQNSTDNFDEPAIDDAHTHLKNEIRDVESRLKDAMKRHDQLTGNNIERGLTEILNEIDTLKNRGLELRLRFANAQLNDNWSAYLESIKQADSYMTSRLEFDDAQYTQFIGMHFMNGTGVFHMEMNSADLPMDKIAGHDFEHRLYFKPTEFGPWLEEMEKRMRYTIETWQLPLGATERRLVNPRDNDNPPKFVEMPIIETIFGSYDRSLGQHGGVMQMAQIMADRALGKNSIQFTDGKGNIVTRKLIRDKKTGKVKADHRFGTYLPEYDTEWEDEETQVRRDNLRKLVGYLDYGNLDEEGNPTKVESPLDDAAGLFTRAYVKTRVANYILAHTDKASRYERWTEEQREDFIRALAMSNYFKDEDIEDIRAFSDNKFLKNLWRENKRNVRLGLMEGLGNAFKELVGFVVND